MKTRAPTSLILKKAIPVSKESDPAWCCGPILSSSNCSATSCNPPWKWKHLLTAEKKKKENKTKHRYLWKTCHTRLSTSVYFKCLHRSLNSLYAGRSSFLYQQLYSGPSQKSLNQAVSLSNKTTIASCSILPSEQMLLLNKTIPFKRLKGLAMLKNKTTCSCNPSIGMKV